MDCRDDGDRIAMVDDSGGRPMAPVQLVGTTSSESVPSNTKHSEMFPDEEVPDEHEVEREVGVDRISVPTPTATELGQEPLEEPMGVTSNAPEASCCHPGHFVKNFLTDRFKKMVCGPAGGPHVSTDAKAVDQLNLQDLKDIRDAVASLNVVTNPAVLACCERLDDQEGRGLLAAHLLGVELVRGEEVPNEAHKVGLQIDGLLKDAKVADDRLRSAARTRKSKERGKEQAPEILEKKLLAMDEKLAADRKALLGTNADLVLPEGPIKVKREHERPIKPPGILRHLML